MILCSRICHQQDAAMGARVEQFARVLTIQLQLAPASSCHTVALVTSDGMSCVMMASTLARFAQCDGASSCASPAARVRFIERSKAMCKMHFAHAAGSSAIAVHNHTAGR